MPLSHCDEGDLIRPHAMRSQYAFDAVGAAVAGFRMRLRVAVSLLQNPNFPPIWMTEGARFSAPLLGFRPDKGSGVVHLIVTAPRVFVPTIIQSSIEYPSPVSGFRP